MITYIALCTFTQQGIVGIKESPKRADAFKELAEQYDVSVREIFWTQGRYDVVIIADAPDDLTASALDLSLCSLGNVRTETLRAFNAEEMGQIIAKMRFG